MPYVLILLVIYACLSHASEVAEELSEHHEEAEAADAILFPSFILSISLFVFYFLTRYCPQVPYTASCFLIGYELSLL